METFCSTRSQDINMAIVHLLRFPQFYLYLCVGFSCVFNSVWFYQMYTVCILNHTQDTEIVHHYKIP
jgi:hypothetical protein